MTEIFKTLAKEAGDLACEIAMHHPFLSSHLKYELEQAVNHLIKAKNHLSAAQWKCDAEQLLLDQKVL